jgi:predicted transcriptional regulator
MVAENYSAARRDMARKIGLGNKGRGRWLTQREVPARR